jgi:hypothetical protein
VSIIPPWRSSGQSAIPPGVLQANRTSQGDTETSQGDTETDPHNLPAPTKRGSVLNTLNTKNLLDYLCARPDSMVNQMAS